ncbi:hypothetical protein FC96_GL001376 [Secundilactobacillus kimchicus JCM 15530]|uniref:YqbQ/XkdQ domain-containing protein n=1 Tax=Secundilactobacillus kimchicus JCM 15530 TaxID=1302272 RepID=A0A0R1I186_9LACO|nr:hypothetical protein [Secundilactobacillus kimchicus]KRK49047.1 hypothetical protein FC96_GL001376 [Secundilactobacillus kimchicus JCM 15530]
MTVTSFFIQHGKGGESWDARQALQTDIKWTTDIDFSAGQLEFKLTEVDEGFIPRMGDIVWFRWDKKPVFRGIIFKYGYDESENFSVTAYDSLRYFKNQDSLVWPVSTIGQRFDKIIKLAGVKGKKVATSSHKLKAEVCDSKSYFDMLKSAVNNTYKATDDHFFLWDNYGTVELRKTGAKAKYYIGDKSSATGFTYNRSIDNLVNTIRVVRSDKTKKQQSSSTAKVKADSTKDDAKNTKLTTETAASKNSVTRYGVLQKVVKAKDKANAAQMKQQAIDELKKAGKMEHTLTVKTRGSLYMTPGYYWPIKFKSLKDIGVGTHYMMITKSTLTFGTNEITAELEMKVRL